MYRVCTRSVQPLGGAHSDLFDEHRLQRPNGKQGAVHTAEDTV